MYWTHLKFILGVWILTVFFVELRSQKTLPKPTGQTHVFDFARFLDNEVSPVKEEMDFFFTAFGSADSIKLSQSVEFLNKNAPKLFAAIDDLPKKTETNDLVNAYLDFARFCMNTRGTLKKWVAVSGRYQWAKRVGKPIPESAKSVWEALVNVRKGYIQQTKALLQKHNEFCARHAEAFELYPSNRVLELMQNLKFGGGGSTAVFIDAVSTLNQFEKGQRYVFQFKATETGAATGRDALQALKENIQFGLPDKAYVWIQMEDELNPNDQIQVMYSARYAKPSAPLLLIRSKPDQPQGKAFLSLELYSAVPSSLKLLQ